MCDALREVWGVWRETPVFWRRPETSRRSLPAAPHAGRCSVSARDEENQRREDDQRWESVQW